MRNLVCLLAITAIVFAFAYEPQKSLVSAKADNFDDVANPWTVKGYEGYETTLTNAQVPVIDYQEADDSRIAGLEKQIGELQKLTATDFDTDKRIAELERKMSEAQSDITDLGNGQADLTKRVEELTALIEVKTAGGSVKTAAVKLSSEGSGSIRLQPGEVLLSIDGVAVNSTQSSGGSSGTVSVSQSYMPASSGGSSGTVSVSQTYSPSSGGSSGNVSTSQVATYQTETYSLSSVPTASGPFVNVQRRAPLRAAVTAPLRTIFRPRASAPQCVGPNCPK